MENNLTETERKTSGPDALPKSLADYSQEGATTSKGNTKVEDTKNENSNYEDHVFQYIQVPMPCQSHWQTTHKRAPPPPRQYQSERYKMKTGTTKRTGYSLIAIT